jgi:hypothetical protein
VRKVDRETDRETEIREKEKNVMNERDINTQIEKKQSDTATYCLKRI